MADANNEPEILIDTDRFYITNLDRFTKGLEQAIDTSKACSHKDAGLRLYWASVLFTRLCNSGVSLLWLSPGSRVNPDGYHWDFGSVASLARNMFECALNFFYLGIEAVNADEWEARLRVMHIHDHMERLRMLTLFDSNLAAPVGVEQEIEDIRDKLRANKYFISLPEQKIKKLLKGEQFCILNQDEILQRMGLYDPNTRGYYRFLSSHAHSFPLAFYRTGEGRRGHGVENDVDKTYMAGALEFAAGIVERAVVDMRAAFGDLASPTTEPVNWDTFKRPDVKNDDSGFDEFIQKLIPQWDVDCQEKGCLMFTDIHRSVRERPANPARPEYITLAVGIGRQSKRPSHFAFHVPPGADRQRGLSITFLRSFAVTFGKWGIEGDDSEPIVLAFDSCDEESCVARASNYTPESGEIVKKLTQKFFSRSHILLDYLDNNETISTSMILSSFREAYYSLCDKELKPSDADPSSGDSINPEALGINQTPPKAI